MHPLHSLANFSLFGAIIINAFETRGLGSYLEVEGIEGGSQQEPLRPSLALSDSGWPAWENSPFGGHWLVSPGSCTLPVHLLAKLRLH